MLLFLIKEIIKDAGVQLALLLLPSSQVDEQ